MGPTCPPDEGELSVFCGPREVTGRVDRARLRDRDRNRETERQRHKDKDRDIQTKRQRQRQRVGRDNWSYLPA